MKPSAAPLSILRFARQIIASADRWTTGTDARNRGDLSVDPESPFAAKWCTIGAVRRAVASTDPDDALEFGDLEFDAIARLADQIEITAYTADETIDGTPHSRVSYYNDAGTHAEVLGLFDRAIRALEKDGAP